MTEKISLGPLTPFSPTTVCKPPSIVFGSQPVTVVIQRPTVKFDFTPAECILLQKHIALIKEFVENIIQKNVICSLCRYWYSELSYHDDCNGNFGNKPCYVFVRHHRICQPAAAAQNQIYLEIRDEILPFVYIHFGGANEDESRKNAQIFLDNWEDFVAYVVKTAALYEEKDELITLTFNLRRATHDDRNSLNELAKKYAHK